MNSLSPFALENYLLAHEHKAELSLCSSGLDSMPLAELLAMSDADTLRLWEKQSLGYSEPAGHPLLRDEVAALYSENPDVTPPAAMLFSGAAEAIACGLSALLSPSDHCIVITPCYQSLKSIPASICHTTEVSLEVLGQLNNQDWELDLEAVRQAIRPNTRLLVMNFPNNPTGALPPVSVLQGLIALAREFNLYIFSDEVYRGLELDESKIWPALVSAYEKGVSVGSLSKLFALPGLRCGWLACQNKSVLDRALGLKHYTTICNNGPGEILALMALRARSQIIPRNRAGLVPQFEIMRQFLARNPHVFEWVPPQGGCLVFPRLISGHSAEQFALDVLNTEKVLVLPGQLYDFPGEALRLSYASKTLPQALERLDRFIGQYIG